MNDVRRTRCGDWFIQSCKCNKSDEFIAWASKCPSEDVLLAKDDVYFDFGNTENIAIEKIKQEVKYKY
jgi:hypothetical protein